MKWHIKFSGSNGGCPQSLPPKNHERSHSWPPIAISNLLIGIIRDHMRKFWVFLRYCPHAKNSFYVKNEDDHRNSFIFNDEDNLKKKTILEIDMTIKVIKNRFFGVKLQFGYFDFWVFVAVVQSQRVFLHPRWSSMEGHLSPNVSSIKFSLNTKFQTRITIPYKKI